MFYCWLLLSLVTVILLKVAITVRSGGIIIINLIVKATIWGRILCHRPPFVALII